MLGDFNSRTGILDELLDTNEYVDALSETTSTLFDIPKRSSQDHVKNQTGIELIELCRTNGYVIVNGRVGKDADIGKVTCKNVSVVDYAITSIPLFPFVHHFIVHDFDEIYSDVHCAIELQLNIPFKRKDTNACTIGTENDNKTDSLYIKWDPSKKSQYIEALDDNAITHINLELVDMANNPNNVTKDNVNFVVNQINYVLINGAKATGMAKPKTNRRHERKKKRFNKPWFDNSCRIKRKQYTKAKNRSIRNKQDVRLKDEAKQKAKEYKKHTRKKDREYKNQLADKLRNMKANDPKLFHNLLNDNNTNQNSKMPTTEQFYDMFKNLNESDENNNN